MKRPLSLGVVYRLDLTDKIMFGAIKKQTLYERFTDGRISGLLSEDLVNALYNNITKAPSEQSTFDIMDNEGNRYECRTITARGVSLLPSNQLGKGRKTDLAAYKKKLESLYAYIFTDIRHSPIFRIVAIPVADLNTRTRLSPKQFEEMIASMQEIGL